MKEENEITQEVKELLDSLEQHGQNARRQKELRDLIDRLEQETGKRKTFNFQLSIFNLSWWIMGAAAACLLFWLLARPALKETPNMNEKSLVEEAVSKDTTTTQKEIETTEKAVILKEPVPEKLLVEETPVKPTIQKPKVKNQKPTEIAIEKNLEKQLLASNTSAELQRTESTDTSSAGPHPTPTVEENELSTLNSQLSPPSSPQRRVIQSLNLVCYECKVESEKWKVENDQLSTLPPIRSVSPSGFNFPLEPDPNMKNGSLAFEVKLH